MLPVGPGLAREAATGFRNFLNFGAGNETRTRDPDLGKVVLYQLSYSRILQQRANCKSAGGEVKATRTFAAK